MGMGRRATRKGTVDEEEDELCIFLDLGSGTQALRQMAMQAGLHYVGIDLRERVFSADTGKWVHNVVMDYTKHSPEEVWEKACEVVGEKMQYCGWKGKMPL